MGPGLRRDDGVFRGGGGAMTRPLRAGIIAAVAALVLDQASKLWLLYVFDIARRGAVRLTPFLDLVLAWNVGISFGWFQTDNQLAQVALMAIKAIAVIVLGSGWRAPAPSWRRWRSA